MKIKFEAYLLRSLHGFNHFLHALVAIALVIASLMVVWEFSVAVAHSFGKNDLAHGFLQALGSLFIVWTLSSLIAAEINYVQTGVFHVAVFIEVAMITLLRQLIVEPVTAPTYRLSQLLKKVSKRNVHREVDTGHPVGNEAW